MPLPCNNRLLVVGPGKAVEAFGESAWQLALGARHTEFLECAAGRLAWQFDTEAGPPIRPLTQLSNHWRTLTFLLVYDQAEAFTLGLARFKTGAVKHHRLRY